jgi:outer membrane protein assembly factor BamB
VNTLFEAAPSWRQRIGNESYSSPLAIAGSVVAIGRDRGRAHMVAALPHTGAIRLEIDLGPAPMPPWCSPATTEETVYIFNYARILAIKAATGTIVAERTMPAGWSATSSATIARELVVCCDVNTSVIAFHRDSLQIAWQTAIGHGPLYATPVCDHEKLYIAASGATESELVSMELATGRIVWRRSVDAAEHLLKHPPRVTGSMMIVPDGRSKYIASAFSCCDGERLWQTPRPINRPLLPTLYDFDRPPLIAKNVAYIGAPDGCLYALRVTDGEILWRHCVAGAIEAPPVLYDNVLLFSSNDRTVRAICLADGSSISEWSCSDAVRVAPLIVGKSMLILSVDGWLSGFSRTKGDANR